MKFTKDNIIYLECIKDLYYNRNKINWPIKPFMKKGWLTWVDANLSMNIDAYNYVGKVKQKDNIVFLENNKYAINFETKWFKQITKQEYEDRSKR